VNHDRDPHYTDRKRHDEIMELEQALLSIPECPSWCDGVEIKYTSLDPDGQTFVRHHCCRIGDGVHLSQQERNRANVVTLTDVVIDVEERDGLDAPQALRLASTLLDAAGRLNEIVATCGE
jgi:hypothetical protein